MKCGLLGKTLAHSYSPQIHSYLGDYSYELIEKQPEELTSFFQNFDFSGLNVTIPYKKDVIAYCNELTDCAKKIGAVNTIVKRHDGTLVGHNTDYFGFYSMVKRTGLSLDKKKVLVLGSGGASATAVAVLESLGAKVVVVSRSGKNNYDNLYLHQDATALVNATPVGMYPHAGISPIDLDLFPRLECVLDIVYNPMRTRLLLEAEAKGIPCENGLWMLIAQAKEAAQWFTGQKINNEIIAVIHEKLHKQMENIVLVGMPGCGKSTIGQLLAMQLGKRFVDADAEIVRMAQMPIPNIFEKFGEDGFRKMETKVLEEIGQLSGLVISTGGGCVTREENYPLLHQNGTIYWIQRETSSLPTDGRPLSQKGKLEQMYRDRKPLYERFADHIVSNNGTVEDAMNAILKGR